MVHASLLSVAVLGQAVFTGSTMSVPQAQEKARLIVVVDRIKMPYSIGLGPSELAAMELRYSAILKGEAKEGVITGVSTVASGLETLPRKDGLYIFFIGEYKGHPNTIKILPRTDENLAEVTKEIRIKAKPADSVTCKGPEQRP